MSNNFFDEQTYKNKDYTSNLLAKGEYDTCTFINCNFEHSDLSNITFLECEFIDCNLSNTNVTHTVFKDVQFTDSKLVGVKFDTCSDFIIDFSFHNCQLDFSSFYNLEIKGIPFNTCKLIEVDFTDANLENTVFNACDFNNAIFSNTNLKGSDLRSSFNFNIDLEFNTITKAKFSRNAIEGLLKKHQIIIE